MSFREPDAQRVRALRSGALRQLGDTFDRHERTDFREGHVARRASEIISNLTAEAP